MPIRKKIIFMLTQYDYVALICKIIKKELMTQTTLAEEIIIRLFLFVLTDNHSKTLD